MGYGRLTEKKIRYIVRHSRRERALDDASRKILAAGEFQNANTENSIALVDKLVEDYWGIMPLEKLISDNGSEFGAHRKGDRKEWGSRFKRHLESPGIKLITSRIKHPLDEW